MSQMTATTTARSRSPRRVHDTPRPSLRVVAGAPSRRPAQLPFVVLCSVLLGLGLIALLVLNTALAGGSYAMHDLQSSSSLLTDQENALREQLSTKEAPANLAKQAASLGMVPSGVPLFIDLKTGQVSGKATSSSSSSVTASSSPYSVVDSPYNSASTTKASGASPSASASTSASGTSTSTTKAATTKATSTSTSQASTTAGTR